MQTKKIMDESLPAGVMFMESEQGESLQPENEQAEGPQPENEQIGSEQAKSKHAEGLQPENEQAKSKHAEGLQPENEQAKSKQVEGPQPGSSQEKSRQEEKILELFHISVRFEGGSLVQAVEDVNLTVRKGDKIAIVGETGSGKSVLLLAILNLLPGSAVVRGQAIFEGKDLMRLSRKELDQIRGSKISYIPQGSGNGMNPLYRVGFQVAEPMIEHNGMNRQSALTRAKELLRQFKIGNEEQMAREYPHTYSGGMRQRALIAMGISAGAGVVLADEPTKGLDEARVDLVVECFSMLEDKTILCVTHDLNFAARISDRICVMYAASQVEYGRTQEVLAAPLHPYTRDMVAALPENGLHYRPGFAMAHDAYEASGCKYAPRCTDCMEKCGTQPPIFSVGDRWVRCWKYESGETSRIVGENHEDKNVAAQSGAPENAAAQSGAPEGAAAQSDAPENAAVQSDALEGAAVQGGAPENATAQSGAPENAAVQSDAPEGAAAQGGAPENAAAQSGAPENAAAQSGAPEGAAAQSDAPENAGHAGSGFESKAVVDEVSRNAGHAGSGFERKAVPVEVPRNAGRAGSGFERKAVPVEVPRNAGRAGSGFGRKAMRTEMKIKKAENQAADGEVSLCI